MKSTPNKKKINKRRKFVKQLALGTSSIFVLPRHVLGGPGFVPPSDKLNIAGIGVGGRGWGVLQGVFNNGTENIVALCDVDKVNAARTFKKYEKAKQYEDFREMLEKQKDIDAVTIATPDHTHAVAAMAAMQMGKHVYVEKPLTHNVFEARLLRETAKKYGLATQMGNQGASGEGTWQTVEWIESGLIGDVTEVHCWTNRPIWPQGVPTPTGEHSVPDTLNWDLWLGPAAMRPYHPNYLPFKWRGWWDFGTGALGDMACHIVDVVFRALKLGYPTSVEASVGAVYERDFVVAEYKDSIPSATKIHFNFPARGKMKPVKLAWYDGGLRPERPDELGSNEAMGDWNGGVIFIGDKGKLMCDTYGANPRLLPTAKMEDFKPPTPTNRRITEGHYQNWVKACKGESAAVSNFDIAGPLTEIILMGNLAVRSYNYKVLKEGKKPGDWNPWDYPGQKRLDWDGENMKVTNFELANQFVGRDYREGWSLK